MFFDSAVFLQFVKDCRAAGITCPIVPGIMAINAYAGFIKMSKFCKTRVPESLRQQMEAMKDDAEAVKKFGVEFGVQMCQDLVAGGTTVLHFYTLNLEKVVYGVMDGLGLSVDAALQADETDAALQAAKGSAWARVGDLVTGDFGTGTVLEIDQATAKAKIEIAKESLKEGQESSIIECEKGQYTKKF